MKKATRYSPPKAPKWCRDLERKRIEEGSKYRTPKNLRGISADEILAPGATNVPGPSRAIMRGMRTFCVF